MAIIQYKCECGNVVRVEKHLKSESDIPSVSCEKVVVVFRPHLKCGKEMFVHSVMSNECFEMVSQESVTA